MQTRSLLASVVAVTLAGLVLYPLWEYVLLMVTWDLAHAGSFLAWSILLGATLGALRLWFPLARWLLTRPLRSITSPSATQPHKNAFLGTGAVLLLVVLGRFLMPAQRLPATPAQLSHGEHAALVRDLPDRAHFSYSGLAYYGNSLFASSNLGLLEFRGRRLHRTHQWYEGDSVVQGPWLDHSTDSLWIQHANDGSLTRLDEGGWHNEGRPDPERFPVQLAAYSDREHFWVVASGAVWRLGSEAHSWLPEPEPSAPQWSVVRGVAPLTWGLLYIVREGIETTPPSPYAAYLHTTTWQRAPLGTFGFAELVIAEDAAFVRMEEGVLFRITDGPLVELLDTPGPCEAIARTSTGGLVASFVGQGVFGYSGEWVKHLPYPYDHSEGEHWAMLAEHDGQIAYATTAVPHLSGDSWTHSGSVGLWLSKDGAWERVEVEGTFGSAQ